MGISLGGFWWHLLDHFFVPLVDDDDDEARTDYNMATMSPIPKIVTTPIKEDFSRDEEEDCTDEWGKIYTGQSHQLINLVWL